MSAEPQSRAGRGGLKNPKKSPKAAKKAGKSAPKNPLNGQTGQLNGHPVGRPEPLRREAPRRRPVTRRRAGLDTPLDSRRALRGPVVDSETFGRWSEAFARFMGTAWFLVGMTVFVGGWLAWNVFAPAPLQFDPKRLNFTLMTLILSLQASYAAPLILLAQNRQADRDRVTTEQDRDRAERALADTEYLAREVAALRIALGEVATRDFLRSELRDLLDEAVVSRKPARKPAEKRPSATPPSEPRAAPPSEPPSEPLRPPSDPPRSPSDPSTGARRATDPFGSTRDLELPTDSG